MTENQNEDDQALYYRRKYRGLISLGNKIRQVDSDFLSIIYTPGVAQPCEAISEKPERSFTYSGRGNTVGIISDGSSALGLGNVGPRATLPILESKAVFFKNMAGLGAYPLAMEGADTDEIVEACERIAPTVAAISLEDLASPTCFEVEEKLQDRLSIPVLHNDQHGTAVTALAILKNVCRLQDPRTVDDLSVTVAGAGAAGIATCKLFNQAGIEDITLCDEEGSIHEGRREELHPGKQSVLPYVNAETNLSLEEAMEGRDVFVGLAAPNILSKDMVRSMKDDPVIIAGAAPDPEIDPDDARDAGASVVCTARFDHPNMVTDTLALPGMFRGVLETNASYFTSDMKLAAATAIAESVPAEDLRPDFILPDLLDLGVGPRVAEATAREALEGDVDTKEDITAEDVAARTRQYIYEGEPVHPDPDYWGDVDDPIENELGLRYYKKHRGPLQLRSKIALKDRNILGMVYVPGLGRVVESISEDPERVYELSCKGNMVAVATNGSAVLGLGDIGSEAARPVMEGKSVLFNTFAGVEAFPLCIEDEEDPQKFIETVQRFEPSLGGVNLEDIQSPECYEIERELKEKTDIPIFHDDQHGTAVVTLAGLQNALEIRGGELENSRVVVNGAGASGLATSRILREAGAEEIIICDSSGALHSGRENLNPEKERATEWSNPREENGSLKEILEGADVFVGLSVGGIMDRSHIELMAEDPVVFAMANPTPEIFPEEAREGGASVVATGRSDYPNQVNNALAFPGIFRGALDVRSTAITENMKLAAAQALTDIVQEQGLREHYILPKAMDFRTAPKVAEYVARAAIDEGVARRPTDPETIRENTKDYIYEGRLYYLP
jgi:malate dehydrogenase (oxaloacetate-decarboxylating)